MRFIIFLFFLPLTQATRMGETVVIEGEDEVTAAPPTVIEGNLGSGQATEGERMAKLQKSLEDKPFFCEVNGKCANLPADRDHDAQWGLWQPTAETLNRDCQRACRNPCVALSPKACYETGFQELVCTRAYIENGKCHLISGEGCDLDDSASATMLIPGKFVENADTGALEPSCPAGVPAPGLPENDFALKVCVVEDKQCACDDVRVRFEPSLRTCRALLVTAAYAQSAYYDEERLCHLRRCRCSPGEPVQMTDVTPSGSLPHVYTLTRVTNWESKNLQCPGGGEEYVTPPKLYRNDFCEFPDKKCLSDPTTDIYHLNKRDPNRGFKVSNPQACKNKCVNLFSCASCFTYLANDGKSLYCVMQRDEPCPEDKIVNTEPWEKSSFFRRLKLESAGGVSDERVKNEMDKVCQKIIQGVPTYVKWDQSYCGFPSSACDVEVLATNPDIGPTSIKPCLTVCREFEECQGVNLDANGCHLLKGKCLSTDEAFKTEVEGSLYMRTKEVGDECVFPEHECTPKYDTVVGTTEPVCTDGSGDCSCEAEGKYFKSGTEIMDVTCKQSYSCSGGIADEGESDIDSLCSSDQQCFSHGGAGYCVCAVGSVLEDGVCVKELVEEDEPPMTR